MHHEKKKMNTEGLVKTYSGGGPQHLKKRLIETHGPPPPFGTKMTDPPLK